MKKIKRNAILCLFISAIALLSLCAAALGQGVPVPYERATIIYRTDSDRLNIQAVAANRTWGQQPGRIEAQTVPVFTVSRLKIKYPHPAGRTGIAYTEVAFRPHTTRPARGALSIRDRFFRVFGGSDSAPQPTDLPGEVWTMDLPKWQLDTVVAKLSEQNFFRRSAVLNAEVYLGARIDDRTQGKKFRALPELDSLILRIRHEGRMLNPTFAGGDSAPPPRPATRAILTRLPAVPGAVPGPQ